MSPEEDQWLWWLNEVANPTTAAPAAPEKPPRHRKMSPERLEYFKGRREAASIVAGREPGRIGRRKLYTDAEIKQRNNERSRKKLAEEALAAGRIPGKIGRPALNLTPEERKERHLRLAKERMQRKIEEQKKNEPLKTFFTNEPYYPPVANLDKDK